MIDAPTPPPATIAAARSQPDALEMGQTYYHEMAQLYAQNAIDLT